MCKNFFLKINFSLMILGFGYCFCQIQSETKKNVQVTDNCQQLHQRRWYVWICCVHNQCSKQDEAVASQREVTTSCRWLCRARGSPSLCCLAAPALATTTRFTSLLPVAIRKKKGKGRITIIPLEHSLGFLLV